MHWFLYRQMAPLLIYKLNWMWTNSMQLVEIRGLQIIVPGKHSQQQTLPLMWSTAFKKEHIRRRRWYNLLIKIEKGKKKKTLRCLWESGGRRHVISHYLDLIPLLQAQRKGPRGEAGDDFLNTRPGCFCGGGSWPATHGSVALAGPWLGGQALRLSFIGSPGLPSSLCLWLPETPATFSMVGKRSKPGHDTLGLKQEGVAVPRAH